MTASHHIRVDGSADGFTLLEMLVVLAILVGLVIIAAAAVRTLRHSQLREEAAVLSRDIGYAFDKSMETGAYFRVEMDLDSQSFSIQETDHQFYLPRGNDDQARAHAEQRKELLKSNSGINQSLASQAQSAGLDPSLFLPPVEPATQFTAFKDSQSRTVKLPHGIRILDVLTARDADKVTNGKAYVYCFPEGFVERAVIHMADRDDNVYTLVTQPVRGSVKIIDHEVDYQPGDLLEKAGEGEHGLEQAQ